jgi:glutathione reductase (NADPH)
MVPATPVVAASPTDHNDKHSADMSTSYDYDLFTIGAGSGGVRASRIATQYGARAAVAEDRYLGGTCVNVGCVPKKLLVYASHFHEEFRAAKGFGWTVGDADFDWPTLIANKNAEIARLNGIYDSLLSKADVEQFTGRATIVDPHTVAVNGKEITAEHILVATGSWPHLPDIPGIEHAISSNEAFFLEAMPKRVLIVGGGYIAVEFAGIFSSLGAATTQLYRGDLFLRGFDCDVRTTVRDEMLKKDIDLRFNLNVTSIEKTKNAFVATLTDNSTITADVIMYATGRLPLTADLGLEAAGVDMNAKGAVVVNDLSQSSVPSIHAIGDVTDRMNLTPVAIAEAMALTATLFGDCPTAPDYDCVPSAVFSQPPAATVGLSEEQARERHGEIDVYRSTFRAMKHTLSGLDEKTMMKLVVARDTDRVLGVHMVGPEAGEIVQGFAVALKAGATKSMFDATVGIHPTSAEEFVTMRTKVEA